MSLCGITTITEDTKQGFSKLETFKAIDGVIHPTQKIYDLPTKTTKQAISQ